MNIYQYQAAERATPEVYESAICSAYVCWLEYGEPGDLTVEELNTLDRWNAEWQRLAGEEGHFHYSWGDTSYFGRDEITGLGADVIDVQILVFRA